MLQLTISYGLSKSSLVALFFVLVDTFMLEDHSLQNVFNRS